MRAHLKSSKKGFAAFSLSGSRTAPPLLVLIPLLLRCALAIPKAAPLQLPPLYEDLERQLVRHPWIRDRALGHLIGYARHHDRLEELHERWIRRTEGESESARSLSPDAGNART